MGSEEKNKYIHCIYGVYIIDKCEKKAREKIKVQNLIYFHPLGEKPGDFSPYCNYTVK